MSTAQFESTRMSYTDTTAQVRCIEPLINNISPTAVPFLKKIGISPIETPGIKYEWLEDSIAAMTGTIAEDLDTSETGVDVTTNEGTYFRVGHVFKVGDELFRVTAVSSDTLTVATRGFAGSTAAEHSSGAAWEIVGVSLFESQDAPTSATTDISAPYNYLQVFQDTINIGEIEAKVKQYGITDSYAYQVAKKFKELNILLEKSAFHGLRSASAPSASVAGTFGGLGTFVTNNVTSASSASLSEALLNNLLQDMWNDAADQMGNLVVVNAFQKRKITAIYSPMARMDRAETTGGVVINTVDTDFGTLSILRSPYCQTDRLYVLNPEFIKYKSFTPFYEHKLPADASTKGEIRGIYTMKVANDRAHGYLYSLATS